MENRSGNSEIFDYNQQQALPNATAALVLGIISIITCWCYGIVGIICGIIALVISGKDMAAYKAQPMRYSAGSYSNLKAGRVCAIIGLILSFLAGLVILFIIMVFGIAGLQDPSVWRNM